jgi:hypothetical protein
MTAVHFRYDWLASGKSQGYLLPLAHEPPMWTIWAIIDSCRPRHNAASQAASIGVTTGLGTAVNGPCVAAEDQYPPKTRRS